MRTPTLLALMALAAPAAHADVMVHLFQWRFNEIAAECESFLGPKGYKAVQITPPNEHRPGSQWWSVYQPVSFTNFTSMGGNEAELKSMIQRCKAVGVDIYADAVINHMAGGGGQGTGGGGYDSGGRSYPDFNSGDFREPRCSIEDIDYTKSRHNVQNCGLLGMPDLNTSSSKVQDVLANYLKTLTSFGVAGFRVDAAKHIAADELKAIVAKAGNPFIYSEVIGKGDEPIKVEEYDDFGMVTEFSYATKLYYAFNSIRTKDGFQHYTSQLNEIASGRLSSDKAQVFVVNHDRERGHGGGDTLSYKDGRDSGKYNLANVFMLAYPYGWPQVMSGYDFGSDENMGRPNSPATACGDNWNCDHRYSNIANMVAFHNSVKGTEVANWVTDGNNRIAFARGNKGFVAINNEGASWSKSFQTGLPAGEYCDVLSGSLDDICSGNKVIVDGSGNATISIDGNSAAAIYVKGTAEPNGKPVVKISGAPTGWVKVGTSVTLSADANDTDNTDEITAYKWSSGETTESITKVMATEGKQTFTVTVTDNEGETATATATINVGDEPATCTLPSLYLRGTVNAWNTGTALSCVGANRWEAVIDFSGKGDAGGEQRFKFTQNGDGASAWAVSWGDKDKNGVLDSAQAKDDIFTTVSGKHLVTVNDASASAMTYTITKADDKPVDAKPVAKITNVGGLTVDIADGRKLVKLSGLTSSDAEGAVTYAWSRGAAASCLEGEATFVADTVGSFPITLTVKDSAGQTATDTVTVTVINSSQS